MLKVAPPANPRPHKKISAVNFYHQFRPLFFAPHVISPKFRVEGGATRRWHHLQPAATQNFWRSVCTIEYWPIFFAPQENSLKFSMEGGAAKSDTSFSRFKMNAMLSTLLDLIFDPNRKNRSVAKTGRPSNRVFEIKIYVQIAAYTGSRPPRVKKGCASPFTFQMISYLFSFLFS